jgi:MerR HTH family regulatory protein
VSPSVRITERELVVYRAHGLVDGDVAATTPALQVRVRRIRRLHRDLGLTYDVIALVLPLVERIEELERRR